MKYKLLIPLLIWHNHIQPTASQGSDVDLENFLGGLVGDVFENVEDKVLNLFRHKLPVLEDFPFCGKMNPVATCGSGWSVDPYTGNCYQIFKQKWNWGNGTGKCKELDREAELASIENPHEDSFLKDFILKNDESAQNFWIGLNQSVGQWSDNNNVTYCPDELSNCNLTSVNGCIAINRKPNWTIKPCNESYLPVCKIRFERLKEGYPCIIWNPTKVTHKENINFINEGWTRYYLFDRIFEGTNKIIFLDFECNAASVVQDCWESCEFEDKTQAYSDTLIEEVTSQYGLF